MTGLVKPYAGTYPITQGFMGTYYNPATGIGERPGYTKDAILGQRPYHLGWTKWDHIHLAQDVGMPDGTPLLAAQAGRVVQAGEFANGEYYLRLLIHRDAVRQTIVGYDHIEPGGLVAHVGQHVTAGQLIAKSGHSGYATGPHLHWFVAVGAGTADIAGNDLWPHYDPEACLAGGQLAGQVWLVPNV